MFLLLACASPDPSVSPPDDDDTGPPEVVLPAEQVVVTTEPLTACTRSDTSLVPADLGPDWDAQPPRVEGDERHGGVTVADFTGDGRLDVYLPDVDGARLYVADDAGTLHEEGAARLPPAVAGTAVHGSPADYDGDGDLDLFVTRFDGANQLLRNDDGVFADVTEASGLARDGLRSTGSAWGDLDADGDLDLVATADRDCAHAPDAPTDGVLWENLGDGTFSDVSATLPWGKMPALEGRVPLVMDLDGDADTDLYFAADRGDSGCNASNLLALRDGDAWTDPGPTTGINVFAESMGVAVGDLSGDGLPDLVVSDAAHFDVLLSAAADQWYDASAARRLVFDPEAEGRFDAWGLALADLDDDGDLDLPAVFGDIPGVDSPTNYPDQRDAVYLQGDDGTFADVGPDWAFDDPASRRGLLAVDLDGDGTLDLVRREIWGPAEALLGPCTAGHSVEVELSAPAPNTRAVGAVIDVVAGDRAWRRWVLAGGTSLYSSAVVPEHVGVGAASVVTVRVTWPDGGVTEVADVAVDQKLRIDRRW